MDGAGPSACPGSIGRYLSGLCVAGLGLCGAGWLVLIPFAFGYQSRGWHTATLTDLATGSGLAVICMITLLAWTCAWRRTLRADGALSRPERGPARVRRRRERGAGGQAGTADPEQVLTALRALLAPVLGAAAEQAPAVAEVEPVVPAVAQVAAVVPGPRSAPETGPQVMPAGPEGIAVIESMLAGAELLMTGCDEEEAW
jgi:hypothetical protein